MSRISRGFHSRHETPAGAEGRVPPGQYVTRDFPVLSAGPTPHTPLAQWTFSIRQDGRELKSWSWEEIQALPAETITVDIWKDGKDISFEARVKARDATVVRNGLTRLR